MFYNKIYLNSHLYDKRELKNIVVSSYFMLEMHNETPYENLPNTFCHFLIFINEK